MNTSRLVLVMIVGLASCCLAQPPQPENIALGKPYTMTPPNYGLCTDRDDIKQLTDGVYSKGYFWTQKETVGWSGPNLIYVTIDLGQVMPISGLSFNTAAGVADVRYPKHIFIYVADDKQSWHGLGDLLEMVPPGTLPKYGTYAVVKLVTNALKAHGRYVQLAVEADASYIFTDEIEVYRGPEDLLAGKLPGEAIPDVAAHMKTEAFNLILKEQYKRDLEAVRADIAAPELAAEARKALTAKADDLAARMKSLPPVNPEGFAAVLPLSDFEREVFALQAEVWRAQGKPVMRAWKANRWENLAPSDEPAQFAAPPAVELRMMNGEVRAEVLNLSNAGEKNAMARLRIEGLPAGAAPGIVTVRYTQHLVTRWAMSVAAALPEAQRDGDEFLVPVPCGMTVQAWFEFHPKGIEAGKHEGTITVSYGPSTPGEAVPATAPTVAATVPLRLTISPVQFPEQTRLLVGGWDYTEGTGSYGVKATNREALIAYLKEHGVNTPWAGGSVMPEGTFDAQGNMTEKPDTKRFDEWVGKWQGARQYMVFLGGGESFAGAAMGTPGFMTRVGNWAHFWAQHMRDLGLKPSQLGYLQWDEPNEEKGYKVNEEWAKAFKAAEPEIVRFVDPQPQEAKTCLPMFEQMTVLCPHRPQWLTSPFFPALFKEQREKGRDLWLYSAAGPTRSFDPFSYYLVQEWQVFGIGGKGSCFWAFGDTGGVSVWNDLNAAGAGPYCPMYLDDTSVTTAKWFEAIREGAEDYEYLSMLRDRVAKLEADGKGGEDLAKAKALLEEGPKRVMAMEKGMNYTWDQVKDRSVADKVRGEVLDLLEKL